MPIVELMRVIKEMSSGDEVELLADDRAFPADVRAWCHKTQNTLIELKEDRATDSTGEKTTHVARVRKS